MHLDCKFYSEYTRSEILHRAITVGGRTILVNCQNQPILYHIFSFTFFFHSNLGCIYETLKANKI